MHRVISCGSMAFLFPCAMCYCVVSVTVCGRLVLIGWAACQ